MDCDWEYLSRQACSSSEPLCEMGEIENRMVHPDPHTFYRELPVKPPTADVDSLHVPQSNPDAPVLTLRYGPYVSCWFWHHSPARVKLLVDALLAAGYGVQLCHEATTDFDAMQAAHDWSPRAGPPVLGDGRFGHVVLLAPDGSELGRCLSFQHSLAWQLLEGRMHDLVAQAVREVPLFPVVCGMLIGRGVAVPP